MATQLKVSKRMLKPKVRITPYAIVCGIVLLAYTIVLLFPLFYGIMNSFKPLMQYYDDMDLNGFPKFEWFYNIDVRYWLNEEDPNSQVMGIFANYTYMIQSITYKKNLFYYSGLSQEVVEAGYRNISPIFTQSGPAHIIFFLINTVWTAIASTLVPVFWCAALGYVCAKYRYKFVGFIYGVVIFRISCHIIGGGSAMLAFQRSLGLYDSVIGYFLFNSGSLSMYFLIMYAYFQGLPDSYMEAAEIDGATQLRILFTIAIPLATTVMSASLVVSIITAWNDYNTPLMYLPSFPTMAYGFYAYRTMEKDVARAPIETASAIFLALPAFIFFIAFRKKLMGNLSVGGIKG